MRIGVFGANFDPPTRGHEDVVDQALSTFDEILLVPSVSHPFDKRAISLSHRLEMLRLFVQKWQKKDPPGSVKIFNVETLIQSRDPQKTKIYTYDVLSELTKFYQMMQKEVSLTFIVGPDNADPVVWKKFYRAQDIIDQWGLFVAKEKIPIRSTSVRALLVEERSPVKLIELVGEPIANYILQNKLYTGFP